MSKFAEIYSILFLFVVLNLVDRKSALKLSFRDTSFGITGFSSFAPESLFNGGLGASPQVNDFKCEPSDSSNTITWFTPAGTEVLEGDSATSSTFYYVTVTGSNVKILYTDNSTDYTLITPDNSGYFTCQESDSSGGVVETARFGIYSSRAIPNLARTKIITLRGFRISTNDSPPLVRELSYQRGTFDFDSTKLYNIINLIGNPATAKKWDFIPQNPINNPGDANDPTGILDNVVFPFNTTCQKIRSTFGTAHISISNSPFLVVEPLNTQSLSSFKTSYCVGNDTVAYQFKVADSFVFRITCPLYFNAAFQNIDQYTLDITDRGTENFLNQGINYRKFWLDQSNPQPVQIQHEKNYICKDKYDVVLSFRVQVHASSGLQVYNSSNTTTPVTNATILLKSEAAIPDTLYCLFEDNATAITWFRDVNPNGPLQLTPVSNTIGSLPYAVTPRMGRADLHLQGDISQADEGYYYCADTAMAPTLVQMFGIFVSPPEAPSATITPMITTPIDVIISKAAHSINCQDSNSASTQPAALIYWSFAGGTINGSIDTSLLLESDSGNYTCIASNVVGQSIAGTVSITVRPPPPLLVTASQFLLSGQGALCVGDTLDLYCIFETLANITSDINVSWQLNGTELFLGQAGIVNLPGNRVYATLTIPIVSVLHTGEFTCVASVGLSDSVAISGLLIVYPPYLPDTPTLISSTSSTSSIYIIWSSSVANIHPLVEETYTVYVYDQSATRLVLTSHILFTNSFNITGLTSGRYYSIRIRGINRFGSVLGNFKTFHTLPLNLTIPPLMNITTSIRLGVTNAPPNISISAISSNSELILISVLTPFFISLLLFVVIAILIIVIVLRIYRRKSTSYSNRVNRIHEKSIQDELVCKSCSLSTMVSASRESIFKPVYRKSGSRQSVELESAIINNLSKSMHFTKLGNKLYNDKLTAYARYNIHIGDLAERVNALNMNLQAEFYKQFNSLTKHLTYPSTSAHNPLNKPKNRVRTIVPYDHTRVKLNTMETVGGSDYINASYINGYYKVNQYIAAQAPLQTTIADFIKMIWQNNIKTIVMLTRITEANRKKCEIYWPLVKGAEIKINEFTIKLIKYHRTAFYEIRVLIVNNVLEANTPDREITQLHYIAWPDHGVPLFSSSLISFIQICKQHHDPIHSITPLLVHCSAGVGRTGTFLALDYILEEIKHNDVINVFQVVSGFRESRCQMVQTLEQYTFIYEALVNHIICNNTFVSDFSFQKFFKFSLLRDQSTLETGFEYQYGLLAKVSRKIGLMDCTTANKLEHRNKNRYAQFVPLENNRVKITPCNETGHDYLNASFVHYNEKNNAFIVAQGPLINTIYDFWKLIIQYKVKIVIMLTDLIENEHEMSAKYWPELEEKFFLGNNYTVTLVWKEDFEEFVQRKIMISTKDGELIDNIIQIQFHLWKTNQFPDPQILLAFFRHVEQIQRTIKFMWEGPILIHCNDGSSRSGTYVACLSALQQLQLEKQVDLFQIVKMLRNSRPHMVPSLDLYIYTHHVVAQFIKSFEETSYSNFQT